MKIPAIYLLFALLAIGCSEHKNASTQGSQVVAKIPLPQRTPYDSVPKEREAYLKRFTEGYAHGLTGWSMTDCEEQEPFAQAKTDGWYAGQSVGNKNAEKKKPNQAPEPTAPSGRGSS